MLYKTLVLKYVKMKLDYMSSFFLIIFVLKKNYKKKKMARAIFDYTKEVLEKVSFNSELFQRELEKALTSLSIYEVEELKIWLNSFTVNKPELRDCVQLVSQPS